MYSVTQRIAKIKQPYGGFVPPSLFFQYDMDKEIQKHESDYQINELYQEENLHGSVIGLVVDYMVRFVTMSEPDAKQAFEVSYQGAVLMDHLSDNLKEKPYESLALEMLSHITGLNDYSIAHACMLVEFDQVMRRGPQALSLERLKGNLPDKQTLFNIKELINRVVMFFKYNPITVDGFTFEDGYTDIVSSGDGDMLTQDTLWDLKVIRSPINNHHTLQLFMYYLLGKRSKHDYYDHINQIGIVNPRLNKYYILEIRQIPDHIKDRVEVEVLGCDLKERIDVIPVSQSSRFEFDSLTGMILGYDAASSSKLGNGMIVRIPDEIDGVTVKGIASDAFNISNISEPLEMLYIPDTVESIGDRAFYGNDLIHVRLGSCVNYIGVQAFAANRLKDLTLPNSNLHVDKQAFYGNQIKAIDLGAGVNYVGYKAIPCSYIRDLYLPDSLIKIEQEGFHNVKLLKTLSTHANLNIDMLDLDSYTDIKVR